MTDEQERDVWGDYNALDLALAKALAPVKGWRVLDAGEGAAYFTTSREWVSACLVVGSHEQFVEIPLFTASVDACLDVLPEDYAVYSERDSVVGIYRSSIWADIAGGDTWLGIGATRAEALAHAVLAWARARQP